ncbi:MAG: hypothetical protein H0X24_00290 [Ktedonobacterales bacterium]|nr:hypothetical protein [Ktedonobacterales bacterium]
MNPFLRYQYDCSQTLNGLDAELRLAEPGNPLDPHLRAAAILGCRFLGRMVNDPDFNRDLQFFFSNAVPRRQTLGTQRDAESLSQFDLFLNLERELLERTGLEANLIDGAINAIREATFYGGSVTEMIAGIQLLQQHTCLASTMLTQPEDFAPVGPPPEQVQAILQRRGTGIQGYLLLLETALMGIVVIGANASATQLSTFGQTMSGELGIALLSSMIAKAVDAANTFS